MRFINLTPHVINVQPAASDALVPIPPSGNIARVSKVSTLKGHLDTLFGSIELFSDEFGDVEGVPDPEEGVLLIVSGLVAAHPTISGRDDVIRPGDLIRDENGRPIGCKGFKRA